MMSIEMIFCISAAITIPLCLLEVVLWYGTLYFLVNHPRFKKLRKFFVKLTFGCHAWHRRRICVASGFGCPKDLQCSPGTTFCKTSCPYFNKPNLLEADMQRITHSTAQTNRETMRNPCESPESGRSSDQTRNTNTRIHTKASRTTTMGGTTSRISLKVKKSTHRRKKL